MQCRIFHDYQTNEKKEDRCTFCNKERDYNTASGFFQWLQNNQRNIDSKEKAIKSINESEDYNNDELEIKSFESQ